MTKRIGSARARRLCFEANKWQCALTKRWFMWCHMCGVKLDPTRDQWDADHVIALNASGRNDTDNLKPICAGKNSCHAHKTAEEASVRAQVRRGADRHFGIKKSKRPMPFGRNSKWKKKLTGEIVPRNI